MMITSSLQYILLIGGRIVDAIDQMLIFFMILIYDDDIAITKCVSLNLNSKFFPKKKSC